MLTTLYIQNFALLKDIKIEFFKGFNVLTGETGAGKSIIIGALNIAMGERGYTENIRTGEEKATIEAIFNFEKNEELQGIINKFLEEAGINKIEDGELIIKREINRAGKGKIFINNSGASLNVLQSISKYLIDIHGQHEHQSLLKNEIHIDLLDDYSGVNDLRGEIAKLYNDLIALNNEINDLKRLETEKQEKLDIINFRINEIETAKLESETELEELLNKRELMVNVEKIKDSMHSILNSLSPGSLDLEGKGILELLDEVKENMNVIEKFDSKKISPYLEILNDVIIKVDDMKSFFMEYNDKINFSKDELNETETRIEVIENMMKKYKKNSIKEIKEYYEELKQEKNKIELNSKIIEEREEKRGKLLNLITEKCEKLSDIRHKKSVELSKKIENELKDLGILKGIFIISVKEIKAEEQDIYVEINKNKYKLTEKGINEVEFLISLNPGEEPKPLTKIASGGEISRIMLAIKNILADVDKIPVMVFDEIDTGISGKIASVVGKKLSEISQKKQIICITHLPQIASRGDYHYSVQKEVKGDKTQTFIKMLDKKDRVYEIAKLLSGEKVTDASLKAAGELLEESKK